MTLGGGSATPFPSLAAPGPAGPPQCACAEACLIMCASPGSSVSGRVEVGREDDEEEEEEAEEAVEGGGGVSKDMAP